MEPNCAAPGTEILVSFLGYLATEGDHSRSTELVAGRFGSRLREARPSRHVGYLTKYLTKSIAEVDPGDKNVPPREHLIMASIAQRIKWRAQYETARLEASPPGEQGSATQIAA